MKYDVVFLSELAIGNTLEMLYAVEYCLVNTIKVGIYIQKANKSFEDYLRDSYGEEVILECLEEIKVTNLIHTFIVSDKVEIEYENYIYINPDALSTQYMSETEQYLSIVRALYPSTYHSESLTFLRQNATQRVKDLDIENKYVIYSGCSSFASVRRWSYYPELIRRLGEDNVIIVGGKDDLNDMYAFKYKPIISKIFSHHFTNRPSFWKLCKHLFLLEPHAHNQKLANLEYSYFDVFQWEELAFIFQHCKGFIGNDGGLMHFASSMGTKGVAIFGATSVAKSKSYNSKIKEIYTNYECQPCYFEVGKIINRNYCISCPDSVKCLEDISVDSVLNLLIKK